MPKSQKKLKNKSSLKALAAAIIATTLLIIFLVVALLLAPVTSVPEFDIAERDWGAWEAHGKIAVFDDTIKPGDEGEYQFILKNESDTDLRFGITLTEYLNTTAAVTPFMQYRLVMNGVNIAGDTEWRFANEMDFQNLTILPRTSQLMTLEWRWLFEGHDENDTLIGYAGGELSVHFLVLAEVIG